MSTGVDIQRLINEQGYRPCPNCSGLLRPDSARCRYCKTPLTAAKAAPVKKTPARPRLAAASEKALGGLRDLPDRRLKFKVLGTPVTQGSVSTPAPGVVKYTAELREWRTAVNRAAEAACGSSWEPANCPLVLSAVFTLPRPSSAPKTKIIHAAAKPDLDKLLRAIGDAMSPKSKSAFRVYTEDSRIVGCDVAFKSYPAPLATHAWALTEPGVTIAISPAPAGQAPRQDRS
ncbi:RusA family crossover junction endodeoxyribonuclease [Streptomyces goshikiensis]|uniref:RusA family crossover junction endodeoxyribonuclease n=1 Tax=Streptomyces goshikiensis TaxID=1942 RepID=UPI003689B75B